MVFSLLRLDSVFCCSMNLAQAPLRKCLIQNGAVDSLVNGFMQRHDCICGAAFEQIFLGVQQSHTMIHVARGKFGPFAQAAGLASCHAQEFAIGGLLRQQTIGVQCPEKCQSRYKNLANDVVFPFHGCGKTRFCTFVSTREMVQYSRCDQTNGDLNAIASLLEFRQFFR